MDRGKTIIAPSLLAGDFSNMREAVARIEKAYADWIHFDVMDGSFVPNLTFGAKMVADVRPLSRLFFDVHLMIDRPERYIGDFAKAGADGLTVHCEATIHPHRVLQMIREEGLKAGVSLTPGTPVSALRDVLDLVDLVLVMTVNPGFGGQTMIESCLSKPRELAEIRGRMGYNYIIEADGGINPGNFSRVLDAGTDALVMGSAFFNSTDPDSDFRLIRNYKKR